MQPKPGRILDCTICGECLLKVSEKGFLFDIGYDPRDLWEDWNRGGRLNVRSSADPTIRWRDDEGLQWVEKRRS